LLDVELGAVGLREALSRLGVGVLALDAQRRVVFANPVGQRLFGDEINLLVGSTSHLSSDPARSAFAQAISHAIRAEPDDLVAAPTPVLLPRPNMDRPLAIYVLPILMSASRNHAFLTHVRVIVLAIDPRIDSPADPALVRDLLGLTLGEARVASLIGSGLAPKEAAQKLGISDETARTALKRVFSKTGVSRQSELSALLAKLVLR
jgi:DNA-binding CsgD family transcriptional regulator